MSFLRSIRGTGPDRSDPDLLGAYQRGGDLQALGWLYERYMDQVYGLCLGYLGERETARDAVLGVFEVIVRDLGKDVAVRSFKAWLFTVAKHYCLMQIRASRTRTVEFQEEFVQSAEEPHPMGESGEDFLTAQLEPCLELLPPDQKTSVLLFYREGKCYKEIEAVTGLTWNRVRSHIQNGRRNLRLCLERKTKESHAGTSTR